MLYSSILKEFPMLSPSIWVNMVKVTQALQLQNLNKGDYYGK